MFKGYFVASVTPFDSDKIDLDSYHTHLDYLLNGGISGLVICGTTGESLTLSMTEREVLIKDTVSYINGRVPIVVGVASPSLSEVISQIEQADRYQVDAIMISCPCYLKPKQDGLFEYFRAAASRTSLPIMIYNNPGRACVDLSLPTLEKLMDIENIVAIKEASPDISRVASISKFAKGGFSIMCGNDDAAPAAFAMGADGVVSVAANVAPKECMQLYNAWINHDYETFRSLRDLLMPLYKALFVESNPIPVKYAMSVLGMMKNELRVPLTRISDANKPIVDKVMRDAGLLR